ncbi:MAG TPA: Spy/CpxP family protein refolding chaperone [Bryobacteraceae bacterium]|nr:Spy/CpxP family protein refolding chaperone [Bryobacteraceae bacterium]
MFLRLMLAATLSLGMVSITYAQRGGGMGGGDMGGDMGGGMGGGMGGMRGGGFGGGFGGAQKKLDIISSRLKLSKEQKKQVEEIFDASQKQAEPLRQQIAQGRRAIVEAVVNGKPDQEINQLAGSEGQAMGQMTVLEMRAFAKLYQSLKEDQQKRAAAILPMMAGMFSQERTWNTPMMGR